MARSANQKIKILYLMQLLLEKTDETHALTAPQLIDELQALGIHAERKTIYDDIETLRLFGLDIVKRKEAPAGYFIASRQFELPELKLLVDTVQASRFITAKKSDELIHKLERLTSHYEARQLQRQVTVTGRIKTMNESIYYNVDKIHEAISANVKIAFQYFEWTVEKEPRPRHGGIVYRISPWVLNWDNENYYMIGYDQDAGTVKHYRVDKMLHIRLTDEPRTGRDCFQDFNPADFSRKTFGMFAGQEQKLRLRFENRFVGVVIDRFGKDVPLRADGNSHFIARVNVTVSGPFFGWLSGLGPGVKILSPKSVVTEYQTFLYQLLSQYKQPVKKGTADV